MVRKSGVTSAIKTVAQVFVLAIIVSLSYGHLKVSALSYYAVSGTVTDSTGTVDEGNVIVNAYYSGTINLASSTTSTSLGAYSLSLPAGTYDFRFVPPSSTGLDNQVQSDIVVNSTTTLNAQLNNVKYTFSGKLTDQNNVAISGLSITIADIYGYSANTTTASDGSFSVSIEPGMYYIGSIAGSTSTDNLGQISIRQPAANPSINVLSNSVSQNLVINTATVNVSTYNAHGYPAGGTVTSEGYSSSANISLYPGDPGEMATISRTSSANNTGKASFGSIVGLTYGTTYPYEICYTNISGVQVGCNTSPITITSGTNSLVLPNSPAAPYTFSGSLVDQNGTGIVGATIALEDAYGDQVTAITGTGGSFNLSVEPGMYYIAYISGSTSVDGLGTYHLQQSGANPSINLTSGNISQNLVVNTATITVNTYNAQGYPHAGTGTASENTGNATALYPGDPGESVVLGSTSNANNSGVETIGSIVGVTYIAGGICYSYSGVSLGCNTSPLTVVSGANSLAIPNVPPAKYTFSGTLTDQAGNALSGASITLEDAYGNTITGTTASNGSFNIAVEPGMYYISTFTATDSSLGLTSGVKMDQVGGNPSINLTNGNVVQNLTLPNIATVYFTTDTTGLVSSPSMHVEAETSTSNTPYSLYPGDPGENVTFNTTISSNGLAYGSFGTLVGLNFGTGTTNGICEYNSSFVLVSCTNAPVSITNNVAYVVIPQAPSAGPTAPTGLNGPASTTTFPVLKWTAATGAVTYLIYRNSTLVGVTYSTQFTDTTLTASGSYSYDVIAVNENGGESTASSSISVDYTQLYSVSGQVSFNGTAAPNVLVDVNASDGHSGNSTTNNSGTYNVSSLPSDSYSVSLQNITSASPLVSAGAPNYLNLTSGSPYINVNGANVSQPLTFDTGVLTITVKDGEGVVIPNAYVTLVNINSGLVYSVDGQVFNLSVGNLADNGTSNSSGMLTMYAFPGVTYQICASFPDSAGNNGPYCMPAAVTVSGNMSIEVDLPSVYTVTGHLSVTGVSMYSNYAEVILSSSNGVTAGANSDQNGNYTINNLPNGTYTVEFKYVNTDPNYFGANNFDFTDANAINVNGSNVVQNISIAADAVQVNILDGNGAPYTESTPFVYLVEETKNSVTTTDGTLTFTPNNDMDGMEVAFGYTPTGSGTVTLNGVFPGESYKVCAQVSTGIYCEPTYLLVNGNTTTTLIAAQTYSVSGTVTVDGMPVPQTITSSAPNGATVTLCRTVAEYCESVNTDASGNYTVTNLINGSYNVGISYANPSSGIAVNGVPNDFSMTSASPFEILNGANLSGQNFDFTTDPVVVTTTDTFGNQVTDVNISATSTDYADIYTSNGLEKFMVNQLGAVYATGVSTSDGSPTFYLIPNLSYKYCAEINDSSYCSAALTLTSGSSPTISISAARPTNLSSSLYTPSPTDPVLTWSPVTGAVSYNIYRDNAPDGSSDVLNAAGQVTFTDNGESEGTHVYYVTAVSASGVESAQSLPVTVIVDRTAPVVTSVSWDNGTSAYGSVIFGSQSSATVTADLTDTLDPITAGEYFVDGGNATAMTVVGTGSTGGELAASFNGTDANYPPGTHTIEIEGENAAGIWSTLATTTLVVNLAAPTGLNAESPTSQPPVVNWLPVDGASYYQVYRNGTDIGSSNTTSFTDTGAPAGIDTYNAVAISLLGIESAQSDPLSVIYDPTPPAIAYTLSPTPNATGWNNSPVTVSFSCSDPTYGVASCPSPVVVSNDGANQEVTVTATDNLGGSTTISVLVNLDQTPPTVGIPTLTVNPIYDGQSTTLSDTASDSLSGVVGGEYFIGTDPGDGNGTAMSWDGSSLTAALGSTLDPGIYTINVRAEDAAGNWSQIGTVQLTVILAAPTNLTAPSPTNLPPALTWDEVTGATSYNIYRNGTVISSSPTASFTDNSAPQGTSTYYVTAVNGNGESEPSASINVLYDTVPPAITYTVSSAPNAAGWYNEPVTITFTCSDPTTGVTITFCSAPVTIGTDGANQTATGTATDDAGNSATVTASVNVDQTTPEVGTLSWTANPIVPGDNTTLSATATAAGPSPIVGGEYFIGTDPGDGNGTAMNWDGTNLSATFGSALAPGTYTVNVRAEDAAGNWSQASTATLTVILEAPTNLTAVTPTNLPPSLSWDAVTGATSYNVYRNGLVIGSSSTTTFTDTSAPQGTSSYYVTAVNSVSESEPSNTVAVLYDTVPPSISYALSSNPNTAGWYSIPVTVTFACSDPTVGVTIATCSSPVTLSNNGANQTATGTATDTAGNSATTTASINIDQTLPAVDSITWSTNPIVYGNDTTLTASVSATGPSAIVGGEYFLGTTDPGQGNGTAMTYDSINGVLTATFGANLAPGTYQVNVRTVNAAGNWSTVSTSQLVVIDPAPTGLTADYTTTSVAPILSWNAVPVANSTYQVWREDTSTGVNTLVVSNLTATTFTDTTATPGTYNYTVVAVSSNGVSSDPSSPLQVTMTQPLTLIAPQNLTVDATSASGAYVSFTISSTGGAGTVTLTCTPTSGVLFAIGTSEVLCIGVDSSGGMADGSFTVTVESAQDQTQALQAQVTGVGTGNSLVTKVDTAENDLSANPPNYSAAYNALSSFINEVNAQSGKSLTTAEANEFLAEAEQIQNIIGN